MPDAFSNFAYSTVAVAPSPALSGTSLQVQPGQGALFPAAPFSCTICPAGAQPLSTNAEIVRVTAKVSDTFTIVRAQESSVARSVVVGDQIAQTVTALFLTTLMAVVLDRQVFTTNGTWTKPTGARLVHVQLVSGGSGGGSGRRGLAGTTRAGGGGGGGGAFTEAWFAPGDLGATVAVVVGTGGAGGAAQAVDDTSGLPGVLGTATDFGAVLRAALNAATGVAQGGTTAIGTAGGGGWFSVASSNPGCGGQGGTSGQVGVAPAIVAIPWMPVGGGGGGGLTVGNASAAGGNGRNNDTSQDGANVAIGGTNNGGSATPVGTPKTLADLLYGALPSYGAAGGGGGNPAGGAGGTAGTGQGFGSGGGGGGGCLNGSLSGAGGAGAPGVAIVTSYG